MSEVRMVDGGGFEMDPGIRAKVLDRARAVTRLRECLAETCGEIWETREVSLLDEKPGRRRPPRADLCPLCGRTARIEFVIPKHRADSPACAYAGPGLQRVSRNGGVYRRRRCPNPACRQLKRDRRKHDLRGTTGEFRADGSVQDAALCLRCGGKVQRVQEVELRPVGTGAGAGVKRTAVRAGQPKARKVASERVRPRRGKLEPVGR